MPRLAQPQRPLIGIQDQRLAVVDRFQVWAGVERDHRTSDQIPPSLPQPAQGHGGTVRAGDVPRQPRAVWPRTPFIKPRGQHQTTPLADSLAEGGLFGHGIRPRIQDQRAVGGRFIPAWHQAPAHRGQKAPTAGGGDNRHGLGGANVEPWAVGQVIGQACVKQRGKRRVGMG